MTQEYLHASLESNIRSPRVSLHVYPACRAALSALRRLEPRLKGLCGSRAAGMPYAGCGCTVCDAHELPAARAASTPATVVTAADRGALEGKRGRDGGGRTCPIWHMRVETKIFFHLYAFSESCTHAVSLGHASRTSRPSVHLPNRAGPCPTSWSSLGVAHRAATVHASPAHAARAAVLLGHQRGARLAVRRDNAIRRSTRATLASVWLPLRTGAFRYR